MQQPTERPQNPNFGSGPTSKRPGFTLDALRDAPLGRSHRSTVGKAKIAQALQECKALLELPEDYLVGMVPGSDTGAFEMAMWNLLGCRPVDVCCWESFGKGWLTDATSQLKLDVRKFEAEYGHLPSLGETNPDHDIIFTWNGTTSGVKVPNGDWISDARTGLTLCDATSAILAMPMPWTKLDVITFSWQKVLGGEAAHGMLILSPRAVERARSYQPSWPIPKVFRLMNGSTFNEEIFKGSPINTVSMLCVEDFLDALAWARSVGGQAGLIALSEKNLGVVSAFVATRPWMSFLAVDEANRSNTSVCLRVDLPPEKIKAMTALLAKEVCHWVR
mmetsp:Transcript_27702/g.65686  ORF Transcript_27702/g.65686 Transcript_27702/m.65686 type:complete len:333 (+) Transcript_27702:8-1006(+)